MKTTIGLLLAATALTAFAGSAMAADLYVPPAAPQIVAPVATNWDGPYIGASIGYGWGTADESNSSGIWSSAKTSGFLAGVQLGYNFHLSDQIVAGIEGNIDWVNESGEFDNGYEGNFARTNWEGSIRGRLGVDVNGILPYIEAGVAFANASEDIYGTSKTFTGWTAGVGVEFMLADQLSANVEYRYSDYGNQALDSNDNIHLTDSTVRVGLNYHF